MATTLREFLIKLGVDADTAKLEKFDKQMDGLKKTAGGVVRALKFVATGVLAAGAGLVAAAQQTARQADEVERLSRALNIGVKEVQEYGYAFNTVDADLSDVADVFNTLSDRAADARGGMKSFQDDFKLIGLGVKDLKADRPDELFLKFADAIAKTPDKTKGAVAAVRILGDDVGNKLLPLLRNGSRGFKELAAEAHGLGVIMSGPQIKAAKEFHKQWLKISSVFRSFRNQLALAVIPKLTEGAEKVLTWITANRAWINERIEDAVARLGDAWDAFLPKLKAVNDFVETRVGGWSNIFKLAAAGIAAGGIFKTITTITTVVSALSTAWGILTAALATVGIVGFGPVIAVVIGVVAQLAVLVLVLDDVMTFFRGGDSLIGRFIEWANTAEGTTGKIAKGIGSIATWIKELALSVTDRLAGGFEALGIIAEPVIDAMTGKLREMWAWISEKIQPALDVVGGLFDRFNKSVGDSSSKMKALRESGQLRENQRAGANEVAGKLRTFFGAAQTTAGAQGTAAANANVANSMASADTYQINVNGGGSPDAAAAAVRQQLESRDKDKRKQAAAMFAGGRR
ncbi:MAG TPA: hypothetical protein VLB27_08645 [candidate division Zixibacteria bacterium]|nr:hypothetical protein [candidate division Zixibacteria bacterium]